MMYDIENEMLPKEALLAIQLQRLRATIECVYERVLFYRQKMDAIGITPEDIRTLDDIKLLPFTTKQDLRDNYPFGLFATPMGDVVRIHASSGTTGQPTVVGYTAQDIDTWGCLMARSLVAGGATPHDMIHNAYGYGLFTGGLGAHYGAEKLGASVIPVSGGNTKRQVMIMKDFKPTILTCTPSYALHLAEVAEDLGVSFKDLSFKYGVFGAEPWTDKMREEIQEKLGLKAVDVYGLSEVMGPGVACECHEAQAGPHIWEDHFIPEIISPETLEPLSLGEAGELVFTSLTKEAFPVIRYRTRDITSLNPAACVCGRTHVRMNRVFGRSDDMLIIRGVNVFPSQIESVLMEITDVEPHYQLIVDREGTLDMLTLQVEVKENLFSDTVRRLQELERKITRTIKDYLGVSVKTQLVEPKTIERSQGKAVRVIDRRNLKEGGSA